MFTRHFWILTAERMIKTFAKTLASVLVAGGVGLFSVGWASALSAAAMAAVVSVLTSEGSLKIGPADSPSVVSPAPAPVPAAPAAAPAVPQAEVAPLPVAA
jgi:hypothetical protein